MKLKNLLKGFEYFWHICAILVQIGAFISLWRGSIQGLIDPSEGDIVIRLLLIFVYAGSLIILLLNIPKVVNIIARTPWLWILLFWTSISFIWSNSPDLAFRRALAVIFATLYSIVIYLRFTFDKTIRLLFCVFTIITIGSYLLIIFLPNWSIMAGKHQGAWRGMMSHKNIFGITSLLTIIFSVYLLTQIKGVGKRGFILLIILSGAYGLIQSTSATAFVLSFIYLFSKLMLHISRRLKREWPIVLLLVMGLGSIVTLFLFQESENIFASIGRDQTLTGRIPLWLFLINIALKRPFLGYGYRTFWMGDVGPSAEVWEAFAWNPPHAHNGFLNIWLEVGLVGLILTLVLLLILFMKSLCFALFLQEPHAQKKYSLIFVIVVFFIFYGVTEVVILQSGTKAFFWILLSYFYIYTNMATKITQQVEVDLI